MHPYFTDHGCPHGRTEEIPALDPAVTIWHCLDCGIYRELRPDHCQACPFKGCSDCRYQGGA